MIVLLDDKITKTNTLDNYFFTAKEMITCSNNDVKRQWVCSVIFFYIQQFISGLAAMFVYKYFNASALIAYEIFDSLLCTTN